ncbi:MAG: glycosyltransferase family 4 protein [Bacillota bacterium]|nr:glycosyltransferase family 4 protein [Bacillota bacterium]
MKICFLLGGFQGSGGIERVTSILANKLSNDSILEIHTMAYLQDSRPLFYDLNPLIHQHVLFTSSVSMTKAIVLYRAVKKVKSILQNERIDILISCGTLFFPLGILACKNTKTKCMCWEHTNPSIIIDHKFQSFCRLFASQRCDHMVVLTLSAKDYYQKAYPLLNGKISQIYNPVDVDSARSKKYDAQSCQIISVGRLSYPKNFDRLIDLAARILPDYPDWIWDIYGEGEDRKKLQRMIDDYQIGSQLFLRGQVSNLYDLYSKYAFMVMTSRYEGFPMSLIEGAANRLPLISFDVPTGPNEIIINNVNGYLIDEHDDKKMLECIRLMINNQSKRTDMSQKSYQSTRRFQLEQIAEEWKRLCEKILTC